MGKNLPLSLLPPAPGWIDTHAHLDRLADEEVKAQLAEATSAGVGAVLAAGTDLVSSEAVVRQCRLASEDRSVAGLFGAAGISPFDADAVPCGWEGRLRELLRNERMIAVGEIGLDATNPNYPSFHHQLPVFEAQLSLAKEYGIPAVVHSRGVEKKVAGICRSLGSEKVMFHCFTGDLDALRTILDYGYSISFSGIITFSTPVAALVSQVPSDRLFIETDAPYLAPAPYRGRQNRPAWVSKTGEAAAALRGEAAEEMQEAISRNFRRLFLREE